MNWVKLVILIAVSFLLAIASIVFWSIGIPSSALIFQSTSYTSRKLFGEPLPLGEAIHATPNELDTTISHQAALQHYEDDRLQFVQGSRLGQSCEEATSLFANRYRKIVTDNEENGEQPDQWAGPHPICGVYLLHNWTKQILVASGPGTRATTTFTKTSFLVTSCTKPENPRNISSCPDVHIAVRLVGPTIIAADSIVLRPDCSYNVTFQVFDPGNYTMEVRVVWYDGLGPEQRIPRHPVTLRKTHTKFGRKPHQKYILNRACENQSHIVGSPFHVEVYPHKSRRAMAAKPLCTEGNATGRWVAHSNRQPCANSTQLHGGEEYCDGDPALLNDAKPFNEDFLWAPLTCKFRFWSLRQGPQHACVSRPQGKLLLMGDSTTREYAQSLRLFDLRKAQLSVEYANWKIEWQWFSRRMAHDAVWRLGAELGRWRPAVLAVNLGPLHLRWATH